MSHSTKTSTARRHKLIFQSAAFLVMMIAPLLLYRAAEAGATGMMLALLGVMVASMGVSIAVS
jgi:hypothetical protein